jgi:hypothetical protein
MSEKSEKPMGTAELALTRMAQGAPTDADRVRAMEMAIRGLVQDARRSNPNALNRPVKVGVAGAGEVVTAGEKRGSGWQEEKPLPSFGKGSQSDRLIGAMCDQALGPATPGKPDENK